MGGKSPVDARVKTQPIKFIHFQECKAFVSELNSKDLPVRVDFGASSLIEIQ